MGAVPSRETLQRGLFVLQTPQSAACGVGKKQDIVLIPLTKEFFPSPDCALFVQFHKARCDAGVNYYFRCPGNPGDLSRIPDTGNDENESSYPSRETLYRGVVERMEEMLFDTDEEMRQSHERILESPTMETNNTRKRVLPILCAVAFRYDPNKLSQHSNNPNAGNPQHLQTIIDQGVLLCGSLVNIVGCFGFVPMEEEGVKLAAAAAAAAAVSQSNTMSGGSQTYHSVKAFPNPSSRDASLLSGHQSSLRSPQMTSPMQSLRGQHAEDPNLVRSGHNQRPVNRPTPSGGSSFGSTPSYDPHQPRPQTTLGGARTNISLKGIGGENYDHFVSLPPPVAAPLAAIVFLTKSAGEQNLSRVSFIAASTYYNQLIDAGVIQRPPTQVTHSPYCSKGYFPPLETFSFSSLMTNVPILSFVYEMRCRWEHLGLLSNPTTGQHSRTSSLNSSILSTSTGTIPAAPAARVDMEMWITEDSMFHGRIGKELAERLCYSLAERPDVLARRVEPPSSDGSFWRFCGLVDRHHPPPLPLSEGGETPVHEKDVYIMGAAVMEGFDEGDVLRFDGEHHVWVADRSIPLDAVVLAAMRPQCKAAREAPPDDPGWVTIEPQTPILKEGEEGEEEEEPEEENNNNNNNNNNNEDDGNEEEEEEEEKEGGCGRRQKRGKKGKRIHVRKGNFYIYRFQLNGKDYYHGTVPDFANPNKKRAQQTLISSDTPDRSSGNSKIGGNSNDGNSLKGDHLQNNEGTKKETSKSVGRLPSFTSALFSLVPDNSGLDDSKNGVMYLPTRVRSAAVDTAMRWMGTLFNYAMGSRQTEATSPVSGNTVPVIAPLSRSAQNLPSSGISTPLARRQPTFVQVGPGATENEPRQEEGDRGNGFVKRFIHETRYVWDWRRS